MGGVVAAVAISLRRPPPPPPPPLPTGPAAGAAGTSVGGLVFRRFKGEHEGFVLKAEKSLGQQGDDTTFQGVDVELQYMARGKPGKARITADSCRYNPAQERAVFQGKVHVSTEDGFELDSESLIYRGDKGLARTTDPVRFKRKEMSGTATGLEYRAETGALELPADVFLRIEKDSGPPAEVRARRAEGSREEAMIRLTGDVEVVQGSDTLKAQRLNINLNDELTAAYRAVAVDDVELRTAGTTPLPGTTGATKLKGPRVLKAGKLDIWFHDDRSIKEATASPDAELVVMPGPGEVSERRRVKARVLAFRFDEQGRLVELQAQRDAVVTAEPLKGPKQAVRTVSAGNLVATFDPESGDTQKIEFQREVRFAEGQRTARGGRAVFEGGRDVIVLRGDPELRDEAEGSELKARQIEIVQATGDLEAQGEVRHTRRAQAGPSGRKAFLSGEDAMTVILAENLAYTAKGKSARYTGGALLRTGNDEVRGDTLVLEEPSPEKRGLRGSGSVVTRLTPRPKPSEKKPPAPIEARANEMVYEDARRQIIYTGEVTIAQGDIRTKSPKATLTLNASGDDVETLVAGEPVEIEQGRRKANGARATYTPANETVLLVGEKVVLKDPEQQVEGRTLTFRVGDDTILVDGQEQVRTEAVIRRAPKTP
jgi:lipopolysaccharide transport protein LptA/LPS export ABC transporter protein LptC